MAIRLNEKELREKVKGIIKEALEDDSFAKRYNDARNDRRAPMFWGFELKNQEGEWEYGDVTFDPKAMTMSCMGVTVEVDNDATVDQMLEALYEKLLENGYGEE